jgi:hypothetical protein
MIAALNIEASLQVYDARAKRRSIEPRPVAAYVDLRSVRAAPQ